MTDVNGVKIEVGQEVYDLSIEKMLEDYGPPDKVAEIHSNGVKLENGKFISWKGEKNRIALAVKQDWMEK